MTSLASRRKYLRIADYLRVFIRRNGLKGGDLLPTEAELCTTFDCSRGPVRKAMDLLIQTGHIERRRGSGSYVREPTIHYATQSWGLILSNATISEHANFIRAFCVRASEQETRIYVGLTSDDSDAEREFINSLRRRKVSGVVKFATKPEYEEEMRELLRGLGLPYVIVNDFWGERTRDNYLAYDECASVEMAVEHLAGLGHRRMALLDSSGWTRTHAVDAFIRALERFGLPATDEHLLLFDTTQPPALERLYCHEGLNPTALVVMYDVMAVHLLTRLKQMELRVPQDVSVVNLNGRPLDAPPGVDLTCTIPPFQVMAEEALKMVQESNDLSKVRQHLYRPKLYVGNSTTDVRESMLNQTAGDADAVRPRLNRVERRKEGASDLLRS